MTKNGEKALAVVLEDVTFILNEIKQRKFRDLEGTKLTPKQEKILEDIGKDIDVCVTKLGKVLHSVEL